LERLPLPGFMHWQVETKWAWGAVAAAGFLAAAVIFGLRLQLDRGPFHAPSEASTRNLNAVVRSLQLTQDRLRAGDLASAEVAVLAALDQAPTSAAARRLAHEVHLRIEEDRTSAENQARVAELVAEGRQLYRQRSYRSASGLFREALELDPMNEIAASFLELADERARSSRPRSSGSTAQRATGTRTTSAPVEPTPRPTPGVARITLYFDSPISAGEVSVTLDGESLAVVPFDFSKTGFLGLKRKGRGTVKRVILTPSGSRSVGVRLTDQKRGVIGSASFTRKLTAGSDWTLRIDLPDGTSAPNFYLVKTAG